MIPAGRTSPPMRDVYCDVGKIATAQHFLALKADSPQRQALVAAGLLELEAQFGPRSTWGQSTRHCRALRGESVTPAPGSVTAKPQALPESVTEPPSVTKPTRAEIQKAYRQRKKEGGK